MLLLGIGAGVAFPALMTLAMSGATPERRGPGLGPGQHDRAGRRRARAGRAGHARRRPQTEPAGAGEPPAAALTGGYHLAFSIGAGLVLAAIAVALTVLRAAARAPARRLQPCAEAAREWPWSRCAGRCASSPAAAPSTQLEGATVVELLRALERAQPGAGRLDPRRAGRDPPPHQRVRQRRARAARTTPVRSGRPRRGPARDLRRMQMTELLVGTKKGLFVLEGEPGGGVRGHGARVRRRAGRVRDARSAQRPAARAR